MRGLAGGGAAGGTEGSCGLWGLPGAVAPGRPPAARSVFRMSGGGEFRVVGVAGSCARSAPRTPGGEQQLPWHLRAAGASLANESLRCGVITNGCLPLTEAGPGRGNSFISNRRSRTSGWAGWVYLETFIPIVFTATLCHRFE